MGSFFSLPTLKFCISTCLILLVLTNQTWSQTENSSPCMEYRKLSVETRAAYQKYEAYKEAYEHMLEISADARHMNYISASLAAVSATLPLISIYTATTPVGLLPPVAKFFTEKALMGQVVGTILTFPVYFIGGQPLLFVTGAVTGHLLSSPISFYAISNGLFVFKTTDGEKFFINEKELKTSEVALEAGIQNAQKKIDKMIEERVNPFLNGISFGKNMRDHTAELKNNAEIRMRYQEEIYRIKQFKKSAYEKFCATSQSSSQ